MTEMTHTTYTLTPRVYKVIVESQYATHSPSDLARYVGSAKYPATVSVNRAKNNGYVEFLPLGIRGGQRVIITDLGRKILKGDIIKSNNISITVSVEEE